MRGDVSPSEPRSMRRRQWFGIGVLAVMFTGAWGCIQMTTPESSDGSAPIKKGATTTSGTQAAPKQACESGAECAESGVCMRGTCAPLSATDGAKNGDETDVDCGGPIAPVCGVGQACAAGSDCEASVCADSKCRPAAPNDGMKNGDETDVDCGGNNAPSCKSDMSCKANADCASGLCGAAGAYAGKCLVASSCTGGTGAGNDCGLDKNESCCTTIRVPAGVNAGGVSKPAYNLDKYEVTVGRMRAFLKAVDANVYAAAPRPGSGAAPGYPSTGWQSNWNARLPGNPALYGGNGWDTIEFRFGPNGCKRGAGGDYGTSTWTRDPDQHDVENGNFDRKPIVCVDWYLMNAFCIWDGGRLPTYAEFATAFYGGGTPRKMPWGDAPTGNQEIWLQTALTDEQKIAALTSSDALFPFMVTGMFSRAGYTYGDFTRYSGDRGTHVAPPGSKPMGAGRFGHMDIAGNVMELLLDSDVGGWSAPNITNWKPITKPWPETTDCAYANPKPADCQKDWDDGGTRVWGGGSWEGHSAYNGGLGAQPVGFTYHATGGRCAR